MSGFEVIRVCKCLVINPDINYTGIAKLGFVDLATVLFGSWEWLLMKGSFYL